MDVDDPLGPLGGEVLTEDAHEACQDDQVGAVALQHGLKLCFKGCLGTQFLLVDAGSGNAEVLCPLQRIGTRVIGDDHSDLTVGDLTGFLGFQQSLQIGAAAGDQNCNSFLHYRITFSLSLSMISPMT